jgi:hypothetical protein
VKSVILDLRLNGEISVFKTNLLNRCIHIPGGERLLRWKADWLRSRITDFTD